MFALHEVTAVTEVSVLEVQSIHNFFDSEIQN